jgi:hypothetical protein
LRDFSFQYHYGTDIEFSSTGEGNLYASNGWSNPEEWGRWTQGHEASLAIPIDTLTLDSDEKLTLSAEIQAFVSENHPHQHFVLEVNGTQILSDSFHLGEKRKQILAAIPSKVASQVSPLIIKFILQNPTSPAEVGISEDKRALGIGLRHLRIDHPGL